MGAGVRAGEQGWGVGTGCQCLLRSCALCLCQLPLLHEWGQRSWAEVQGGCWLVSPRGSTTPITLVPGLGRPSPNPCLHCSACCPRPMGEARCPGGLASRQMCRPELAVQGEEQASLRLHFDGAQVRVLYMSLSLFFFGGGSQLLWSFLLP